jgi:hypothetical protein
MHHVSIAVIFLSAKSDSDLKNKFFFSPDLETVSNYFKIPLERLKYALKTRRYIPNMFLDGNLVDISLQEYFINQFISMVLGDKKTNLYAPEGFDVYEYWNSTRKLFRTR